MGGIQTFVNVVKSLIKGSTKSTFRNNPLPLFLGNIPKEYHFFLLLPNNDPINPQAMIPVWRQRIDQSNFFWFVLKQYCHDFGLCICPELRGSPPKNEKNSRYI